MGMANDEITKLNLEALRSKEDAEVVKTPVINFNLEPRLLPKDSKPIIEWLEEDPNSDVIACADYIVNRGMELDWYNWHWSPENGYRDRLLLPFYCNQETVGWTGRKITEGKPKYLTDAQAGYVFNVDPQQDDREYVLVVEGQFDAIAVDGVAIMHNEPNATQIARIKMLGKTVIVVPDRDKPGAKIITAALENEWAVSIPPWESDIKDCADAVKKYGRLYTLLTIINYKETNKIKIQLLKKKLENLDE